MLLTVFLAAMVVTSSCISVFAATTLHNPQVKDGVAKWERIKFGKKDGNDLTWRVLKVNKADNSALVLMDGFAFSTTSGSKYYAMSSSPFVWKNSLIRTRLEERAASWFTNDEQNSICSTSIDGTDGDKLFILTRDDLLNTNYGFIDGKSRAFNDTYYYLRTAKTNAIYYCNDSGDVDGDVAPNKEKAGNYFISTRPAMWIKLDANFTYAGTIDSNGNVNETEHLSESLPNTDSSDARGTFLWIFAACAVATLTSYIFKRR